MLESVPLLLLGMLWNSFFMLSSLSLPKALFSFSITFAFRIGSCFKQKSATNARLTFVGFSPFRILIIFSFETPVLETGISKNIFLAFLF